MNARQSADLRLALDHLRMARSCGAWEAIPPLAALAAGEYDFVIDFAVSETLGAPLILARERARQPLWVSALSPGRRRVAEQVLQGLSNKAIARTLGLSLGTVKDHVHAILAITGFTSRSELLADARSSRS